MAESILRRYNFRLYPNRIQSAEMDTMRRLHCTLYNAALQQRIDAYRLAGVSLTLFTQNADIKTIRADDPAYAALSADSLSATLKRLDLAYQAFYRRAKAGAGKESGFPKYKRSDDYPGFGLRNGHGWKLSLAPRARKGTMYVKGVTGQIALRGKFPGPPISVRTCDVKLHGGIWWASIAVELPARMRAEQQHSGEITFDLVDHFARVRRVNGGHAAGPEDTVYAAADGRIFPVFERVIPHQAEASDEHQESVGDVERRRSQLQAESSGESQGSVGVCSSRATMQTAEASDERRESVGRVIPSLGIGGAGSSDERRESVGDPGWHRQWWRAEASDERRESVGARRTTSHCRSAGSSDEQRESVGIYLSAARIASAGSPDERQRSVGDDATLAVVNVGVGGMQRPFLQAESPDERQESVGQLGSMAGSPDKSQWSVGQKVLTLRGHTAGSTCESEESVGESAGPGWRAEAGSTDERQASVGNLAKAQAGSQAGDINSGNLCMAAGSPPENQKAVGTARSVKDLQRGMAKCKRGSRRYRYRRRIKAKREARVARQRRESLHVWSTTLVRRYASLVIIKPPLVEATQSGAGTEREPGAAVALKAEVNRHVLDQAPGLAISMLEYKLAERGGTAKIIETRAAPVLAGNLVVAATKANRRLKRTAARA